MKTEDLIATVVIIALFVIAIKVYIKSEKNINRYINILKKEEIILVPISILMLMYQIHKSGQWYLSPETSLYISVFFNLICILLILGNKSSLIRRNDRYLLALSLCIVFVPVLNIVFFIIAILGI
ncbi:hypothetical protein BCD91_004323 [Clostridium beijerinckii]|uniref:hypothetical protein n=1 Tax=Clostridium beijerinckii TaxID=1520 RepID=UPI001493FA3F|nr:hypothetical protein [Clostridium beijerinckii]NOW92300.1 hypothetical protein [Clostridium beijerinckii]